MLFSEAMGNRKYGEKYLLYSADKSAQIDIIQSARHILEQWFERYPESKKEALKRRFQTNEFDSAFFELYLHELLLRLGYTVDVEPEVENSKRPEFLVTDQIGKQFILEAVLAGMPSPTALGKRTRLASFFHGVNDLNLNIRDLSFMLWVNRIPDDTLSPRQLGRGLSEWASQLDIDEINMQADAFNRGEWRALPRYFFPLGTTDMEFIPIPRSADQGTNFGRLVKGPIFPVDRRLPDHALQQSLEAKAGKYGKLDKPYVVAVNLLNMIIGPSDIQSALFRERVRFSGVDIPRGVWTSSLNTHMSAALFANSLSPENLFYQDDLCLYHNVWAKEPLGELLTQLSQAFMEGGDITFKNGIHPKDIFGLHKTDE